MAFEKLKNEGNACFKKGQLQEAIELYSKALDVDPQGYVAFSNRSLAYYKLDKYERALEDANECVQINSRWAKGHLRRASALIALGQFKEAKEACVVGFSLQDRSLCDVFVEEWLKASKSLVSDQFDHLKRPPWSDVIPEATELFCDEYCDILFTVTYKRLSDADGMSHEVMVKCAQGAVAIADKVLAEFQHPATPLLQEWVEVATLQFESYPKSKWGQLMEVLQQKTGEAARWLKDGVHPSLRKVLNPIIILTISAMLTRGNVLCQAYTGHNTTEYLGYACVGFFEQEVFKGPEYVAFNMAVLSMILNSYRLRGTIINDEQVQLIRGICHKIENLLQHLPRDHKNYDAIVQHYQHTVKVFREVCAKVISRFTGAFDPKEALSDLEVALLQCDSDPSKAMDTAVKYLTDIASKTEASKSGSISHINFCDAENMLYITGILSKLDNHDQALHVFNSGESMALSLLATVLEKNVLSLDALPAAVTNPRRLVLSGAMWLKDKFPEVAADALIRWKSFFTEFRAILIPLGLRDNYRAAFQAIEDRALTSSGREEGDMLKDFQAHENQIHKKYALSTIRAMYKQDYKAIARTLGEADIAIDYTFQIYNPEHRNPPQSQACVVVVRPRSPPIVLPIDNQAVHDLVQQWPKAIYKHWHSQDEDLDRVSKSLSDALFPDEVKKALLDPVISRVFISPDSYLMCFPIDQLPLTDETGSTLPLFERFAISVLSSPRELTRKETIRIIKATIDSSNDGDKHATETEREGFTVTQPEEATTDTGTDSDKDPSPQAEGASVCQVPDLEKGHPGPSTEKATSQTQNQVAALRNGINKLEVDVRTLECYIVANPDYKHERPIDQKAASSSMWSKWLGAFSSLLIAAEESETHAIQELKGTQKEADTLHALLSSDERLKVLPPLAMKDALLSSVLSIQSPHLLHLATHGYSAKQENVQYRGNFWTDQTSGVLLAGAQTFRERKFDKMDVKAGTGHMSSIAACGMQLEGTRLVFVSACVSSVGPRPVQEMPDSLTQALRAAGAETVVSTLWQVVDDEAGEFTHHFYERLVNVPRSRPSEALRHAKVMMKRAGKSMLHWGAYVCHGLDNPFIP